MILLVIGTPIESYLVRVKGSNGTSNSGSKIVLLVEFLLGVTVSEVDSTKENLIRVSQDTCRCPVHFTIIFVPVDIFFVHRHRLVILMVPLLAMLRYGDFWVGMDLV